MTAAFTSAPTLLREEALRLDRLGLWGALEGQVREFIQHSPIRCGWSMDIAPGLQSPPSAMSAAVYGIFTELLRNVAHHAQASEVEIRVSAHASDITVVVKDNGRGAPPSLFDGRDAHGIRGMREQASQFGGWLHIDSQMNLGTMAILTMPMYQRRQAFSSSTAL